MLKLFFDAANGLLVKARHRMSHPLFNRGGRWRGALMRFQDVAGVKYPPGSPRRPTARFSWISRYLTVRFLDKIAEETFSKP